MLKKFGWTALAAAAILTAACIFPFPWLDDEFSGPRSDVFVRTVPLEPGGTIQLENGLGDIDIRGWDRPEVEITAENEEDTPFRRLAAPEVEVLSEGQTVRIRALLPERERDIRSVRFYLSVPKSVNLDGIRGREGDVAIGDLYGMVRIEMGRGQVHVENFSGPLEVTLGRGSVDAEVLDLRPDDKVRISAADGDIALFLAADTAARIQAAAGAEVESEFDPGRAAKSRSVDARIGGEPGASIVLSAPRGGIRLLKSK
jgi:hypothetical protein